MLTYEANPGTYQPQLILKDESKPSGTSEFGVLNVPALHADHIIITKFVNRF